MQLPLCPSPPMIPVTLLQLNNAPNSSTHCTQECLVHNVEELHMLMKKGKFLGCQVLQIRPCVLYRGYKSTTCVGIVVLATFSQISFNMLSCTIFLSNKKIFFQVCTGQAEILCSWCTVVIYSVIR